MMSLFLQLLLAHFIGDFVFQPTRWVKDKQKHLAKSKYLYYHIIVHALALIITLKFDINEYYLPIIIIITSHYIIDVVKLYSSTNNERWWYFWLDQAMHILILFLVAIYYYPLNSRLGEIYSYENILLATSLVFVTMVLAVIMKLIMGSIYELDSNQSIPKAGTYIGILERLLIFTFVVVDEWQAIGFLIAAKSIFRFGDLSDPNDRKKTEYILIGTLSSVFLAILIALIYKALINQ